MKKLATLDREEFCYVLDRQLEKTASFYSSRLTLFSRQLTSFKNKIYEKDNIGEYLNYAQNDRIPKSRRQYEEMGDELLELFAFIVTNIITLRQILIRYDAYARTVGAAPLTDWYMETRQNDSAGFQDIFQFEILLSMRVIFTLSVNELQIQYMRKHEDGTHASIKYMQEFNVHFAQFKELLERSHHSVEKSASGKLAFKDHFISTLRDYFLLGSIQRTLNLEPSFLRLRGRHLKEEIEAVVKWRKSKESKSGDSTRDLSNDFNSIAPENMIPLALNLVACFLYMMNNYIVEPSSAYYANELGQSDALSGLLIGAMPMANIGAAVGYSVWTNYSYRQPLFFAGVLILLGNIMYSFAYNYKSVTMCILGRAITGLGGPRLINRRYVADATPYALRTAASASFAAATSLGAAMGPAAAIILDFFDMEIKMPNNIGVVYLNGMTG